MILNSHIKKLVMASIIYGGGSVIQRLMTILLLPFFTQVLSPTDYGIIALISLVGIAMNGVISLGTGNSMGVMYFSEKNEKNRAVIIWTNFFLLLINCIFWYWTLFLMAPSISQFMFKSDQYSELIRISFLGSVLVAVTDPFLAYLRMEDKAKKFVFLTVLGSLITVLISIFFVLSLKLGVKGLILSTTLGSGLTFLIVIFSIGKTIKFGINFNLFIPLVRIGVPSVFGVFAFLVIDYADRQMIERFVGIHALGVYSIGYSFGMLMMLPVGAFCSAWPPFFMSYINKRDQAASLFGKIFNYYLIFFSCMTIFFFAIALFLVKIFTADSYHDAWTVVGLTAAAYSFKGCYAIIQAGMCFERKFGLISIIDWTAALLNILLNFLLIPTVGIVGAALATFLSYLSLPIIGWSIGRGYLRVDYKVRNTVGMICLATLTSALLFFISKAINDNNLNGSYYLSVIVLSVVFIYFSFRSMLKDIKGSSILERLKN